MSVGNEQMKQLLGNLMDHRNVLVTKIEKDKAIKYALDSELGMLEDSRDDLRERLEKEHALKKQYDQSIHELEDSVAQLNSAARKFADTFAGLGKSMR